MVGLSRFRRVSECVSLLGDEPAFVGLSLRGKFPFPAHGGDWFDGWLVGLEFEPN